ncbi:MAG: hypothetical protein ACOVOR_00875 [Rhabdochlamydiaceae bacterium]
MKILSLFKDRSLVKVTLVQIEKENLELLSVDTFSLNEEEDVKQFYNLLEDCQNRDIEIVSGLAPSKVFLRVFELSIPSRYKLKQAIPFQVESLLPYSLDESVSICKTKKIKKNLFQVSLVSTKKEYLHDYLSDFHPKIQFNLLSHVAQGVNRYICFVLETKSPFCFLYADEFNTIIGVSDDRHLVFFQSFSWNRDEIQKQFELKQKEVLRLLSFLHSRFPNLPDKFVLVLDKEDPLSLSYKDLIGQDRFKFEFINEKYHPLHASLLGLALERFKEDTDSIHFIEIDRKIFLRSKIKKMKRLFKVSLAIMSFIFIFTRSITFLSDEKVNEKLSYFVPDVEAKSYEDKINELNLILDKETQNIFVNRSNYQVNELIALLASFEEKMGDQKIIFNKVSYSLTLPRGKTVKINQEANAAVELVFDTKKTAAAELFKKMLLDSYDIIDINSLKWTEKDGYKVSFFLNKRYGHFHE